MKDTGRQRDRLFTELGEQTYGLLANGSLPIPTALKPTVEKLHALLSADIPRAATKQATKKHPATKQAGTRRRSSKKS